VFLDRDGTIIEDSGYVGRPRDVVLVPGAAEAIRRFNVAGVPVIVITNQSGIARGYFSADDYERVRGHVDELLAAAGARIDASFHCPHHPDFTGPCACRKPGRKLFDDAARECRIDPARSWFVGDRWRDVEPARAFGGRGILVPGPHTPPDELARAERDAEVAPSLAAVADLVLAGV
jgi:histidinol-phosphate phosphatase family protein